MARVFISYASEDRDAADEIAAWLRNAGHDVFQDHDLLTGIHMGQDWRGRLYQELRRADAVVGVVSRASIASSWCAAELGIADAIGCRLLPVRIDAGSEHPLLAQLQHADYTTEPDHGRERILQALGVLENGRRHWRSGNNPYPGLRPFTEDFGEVFFGRDGEARDIANRLRMGTRPGGSVLTVVGPSGCGKSSLLRAAILPLLAEDNAWLVAPTIIPGVDPVRQLAGSLATVGRRHGFDWTAGDVGDRFATDGLARIADELLGSGPPPHDRRLLVAIDQAEQLFTASPGELMELGQLLRPDAGTPVQLVMTMRSEFLDDLRHLPGFDGVPIDVVALAPLDAARLRTVVEAPARMAELRFEGELATELVADTSGGEALPLLAFTLRELADGVPAGGMLTFDRYRAIGGVRGALSRHADAALAEAVEVTGITARQVLAGMIRLVTVDENGRQARRRVMWAAIEEPLHAALEVFVDRRLLRSGRDDREPWLDVAHEALLTAWPPFAAAIAEVILTLQVARGLEDAAAEWERAGRSTDYLWSAPRLAATQENLGLSGPSPPIVDVDERAAAFMLATDQHIRDVARRAGRRRRWTVTALSALVVLALIAASLAVWQAQASRNSQRAAIARGLLVQADLARERDPRTALRVGLAAVQIDPGPATYANLTQTLAGTRYKGTVPEAGTVAFRQDAPTLTTISGNRVTDWDITQLGRPRLLSRVEVGSADATVTLAPAGAMAATLAEGRATLWDLADRENPRQLGEPIVHARRVTAAAFTVDGRMIATAGIDRTVILWDLTDREHPRQIGTPLTGHPGQVLSIRFSPDGKTLATSSNGGTTIVWDLTALPEIRPLGPPLPSGTAEGAEFSPDGTTLVTWYPYQGIQLWDLADRRAVHPLGESAYPGGWVTSAAFSRDGLTLATTDSNQNAVVWDVHDRSRARILERLPGHTGTVVSAAFAPDGGVLATAGYDGSTILWDLSPSAVPAHPAAPLNGLHDSVSPVVFTPDGHVLATVDGDRAILWNVADPSSPIHLADLPAGQGKSVESLAFTPDGHTAATVVRPELGKRAVLLWDTADPGHPRRVGLDLTAEGSHRSALAFSRDGLLLVVAADQFVYLWDLVDRSAPQLMATLDTRSSYGVDALGLAPDGLTLMTATGQWVQRWDIADRREPRLTSSVRSSGHAGSVDAATFTPDLHILATGGSDHVIILWDLTKPGQPRLGQPLTGHDNAVLSLAISPDGRTLASGSQDTTIRLWDLSDPAQARPLSELATPRDRIGYPHYLHRVESLAFSPDGSIMADGSFDRTAGLWDLRTLTALRTDVVGQACARLDQPLVESTWGDLAPGFAFHDICAV